MRTSTLIIALLSTINCAGQVAFQFDFKTFNSKDTLTIFSEVRDCGEFGGHNEYITITYDKNFVATFKSDKPCKLPEMAVYSLDKIYKDKIDLTDQLQKYIVDYIKKFKNYKDNPDVQCNAPSGNYLKFRKDKTYLADDDCEWKKVFESFRDSLFKNK